MKSCLTIAFVFYMIFVIISGYFNDKFNTKCGLEEEDNGEDLDESNCLVGVGEVEGGFGEDCLGVEMEVLVTAHLYLGGQSKAR